MVRLCRGQSYSSFEAVQAELNAFVTDFAPKHLRLKIPYMTVGEEQGLGWRQVLEKGRTCLSGCYCVEDVFVDGLRRRLVFLSAQTVVQTEVLLKPKMENPRNGTKNCVRGALRQTLVSLKSRH